MGYNDVKQLIIQIPRNQQLISGVYFSVVSINIGVEILMKNEFKIQMHSRIGIIRVLWIFLVEKAVPILLFDIQGVGIQMKTQVYRP